MGSEEDRKRSLSARAKEMKDAGYFNVEIADALGVQESTVRILLYQRKLKG